MDRTEVLAVESAQYVGDGEEGALSALVPRVIGQTAAAVDRKDTPNDEPRNWDIPMFLEEITTKRGAEEADIARHLHGGVLVRGT